MRRWSTCTDPYLGNIAETRQLPPLSHFSLLTCPTVFSVTLGISWCLTHFLCFSGSFGFSLHSSTSLSTSYFSLASIPLYRRFAAALHCWKYSGILGSRSSIPNISCNKLRNSSSTSSLRVAHRTSIYVMRRSTWLSWPLVWGRQLLWIQCARSYPSVRDK